MVHCTLTALAISGRREKYEQLRNLYNFVMDDDDLDTLKVPPLGELRGMSSICGHIFCRWVGGWVPREVLYFCVAGGRARA